MTNKEFIKAHHSQGTEFAIYFREDHLPSWDSVKVTKVSDEGCTLVFTESAPDNSLNAFLDEVLGEVLEYTWDELTNDKVDMKEILV